MNENEAKGNIMKDRLWFVFRGSELLIENFPGGSSSVPLCEEPPTVVGDGVNMHTVEPLGDMQVTAYSVGDETEAPPPYEWCGLRASFYRLPADIYLKAGKCAELVYWDGNTRYCGRCGGVMHKDTDISKRCERCGNTIWPKPATAIIVLLHRGDDILLVRANNFRGRFFGLIAGFVETGETLEHAVEREVMEETALTIRNINYYGSQPWPYPFGLMVGFFAEYAGGEITLQRTELTEGGWYNIDNLPPLPEKLSIARRMIDRFLSERGRPLCK